MGWPQWTVLGLMLLTLLMSAHMHGKPIKHGYNFPAKVIHTLIWAAILYAGGFFTPAQAQVPQAAARHKHNLVRQAHAVWGLNAPIAVFAAQVHQESAWNSQAVSRVGARGMAQFMPATARWWCERERIEVADCLPNNPTWALRAMVGYDKFLYDRVPDRFSRFDRMWLALRGYNGGEGHWQAEARSTGLREPTRAEVDAACGKARRAAVHCKENLGYPRRILLELQPRYASWGPTWEPVP